MVFQFFTGIHLLVIEEIREIILNLQEAHENLLSLARRTLYRPIWASRKT